MSDNATGMNAILAEYNTLRQEILGYQRDSMSILTFTCALAALSFGYAVHAQQGLFFFILTVILSAPILLQVQRLRSTYRIGRYIQIFLEGPHTGLRYEGRWITFKSKYPWHESLFSFKFAVTLPILLLQGTSTFLMAYFFKQGQALLIVLFAVCAALVLCEIWLVRKADYVQDLLPWLTEIKEEERMPQEDDVSEGRP